MNSYDCYFDGSHKPEISGCAFIIEVDGEIVYSQVSPAQLKSSHRAERLALHLLLQYIGESISLGSTIRIFGDAKWMIDVVNHETSGSKGHKTRALLHKLRLSVAVIKWPKAAVKKCTKMALGCYTFSSEKSMGRCRDERRHLDGNQIR